MSSLRNNNAMLDVKIQYLEVLTIICAIQAMQEVSFTSLRNSPQYYTITKDMMMTIYHNTQIVKQYFM